METTSLIMASLLVLIPIFLSYKEHLGLEKDIVWSMVRAIVQLVIVGYLLEGIFGLHNPLATSAFVLIMMMNAALNTKKHGNGIKHVVFNSFVAMFVGTVVTMSVLVASKAISFKPNEVIPVGGMIISNAMVAIGLSYKQLRTQFQHNRMEVEVKLSLGAEVNIASKEILKDSIKTAIMPTIDSAKTLGIVALPGMMTGLIIAGTHPIEAIKFQIMVTFMILSSSSVAAILATYMSYRDFFNKRKQLKP